MNALATKFQVGAAAVALAATTALAPVVASAAPAVQVPAAPVAQAVGELPQAPGDLLFFSQVASLQFIASNIRFRSFTLESRATRLQAYANLYPGTFFGNWAAATAERLLERRAYYGNVSFSACRGGSGIVVGPYGSVTGGPC
ncbi:hypothetical protein [Mycobacterium sp. SMC-4]|uniref:hypothetical protein n=1 Tax=Mycobacterium sp. SMC-4 TaxID=2857059 RepID=UPI0021B45739|nr:hypothetical protein [Mycobacterium sp. SMC-4]UXA19282.1 hypothetical protein KXD98_06555 [Mycobacterium sp. SMC-4]